MARFGSRDRHGGDTSRCPRAWRHSGDRPLDGPKAAESESYEFEVRSVNLLGGAEAFQQIPANDSCSGVGYDLSSQAATPNSAPLKLKPTSSSARFVVTGDGKDARARGKIQLKLAVPFDDMGTIYQESPHPPPPPGVCDASFVDCGPGFTATSDATIKVTEIGRDKGPRVLNDPGYEGSADPGEFIVAPPLSCSGFGRSPRAEFDAKRSYCDERKPSGGNYDPSDVEKATLTINAVCDAKRSQDVDNEGRPVVETSFAFIELKLRRSNSEDARSAAVAQAGAAIARRIRR